MCLSTIEEVNPTPTGFGWKVFKKNGKGELIGATIRRDRFQYNVWYRADGYELKSTHDGFYKAGFHIALSRQAARDFVTGAYGRPYYVVRKVEYREAHTAGIGQPFFPGKQVIAAEIRILKAKETK